MCASHDKVGTHIREHPRTERREVNSNEELCQSNSFSLIHLRVFATFIAIGFAISIQLRKTVPYAFIIPRTARSTVCSQTIKHQPGLLAGTYTNLHYVRFAFVASSVYTHFSSPLRSFSFQPPNALETSKQHDGSSIESTVLPTGESEFLRSSNTDVHSTHPLFAGGTDIQVSRTRTKCPAVVRRTFGSR
jgi:hypothetical protein